MPFDNIEQPTFYNGAGSTYNNILRMINTFNENQSTLNLNALKNDCDQSVAVDNPKIQPSSRAEYSSVIFWEWTKLNITCDESFKDSNTVNLFKKFENYLRINHNYGQYGDDNLIK